MIKYVAFVLVFALLFSLPVADARPHKPNISNINSQSNPIVVEDIEVSQVWYMVWKGCPPLVLCDPPTSRDLWLEVTVDCAKTGFCPDVFIQAGVPKSPPAISTYNIGYEIVRDFDSSKVLDESNIGKYGPTRSCDLSDDGHSFSNVPCVYYEPFTDVYHSVLLQSEFSFTTSGKYYIHLKGCEDNTFYCDNVAWIAIGEKEEFSPLDYVNGFVMTDEIRELHGESGSSNQIFALMIFGLFGISLVFLLGRTRLV